MTHNELEVSPLLRDLAILGLDNMERVFGLFFAAATKSTTSEGAESIALLQRVIGVKLNYAHKLASASDLSEATELQFAYFRAQVEIAADLIRVTELNQQV